MYIQEAVKKSLQSGKWIRRKGFQKSDNVDLRILPTDTCDCCIIASFDEKTNTEKRSSRRWNPFANDLIADDWEVVEEVSTASLTTK